METNRKKVEGNEEEGDMRRKTEAAEREEEDDKDDRKANKKMRHEILSRMNQAAERVLFLARIYVLRRSQGGRYLEAGVAESASPI